MAITGTFAEILATVQTHAVNGFWVRSMMYERDGRNGQSIAARKPTMVTGPTMVSTRILLISEVSENSPEIATAIGIHIKFAEIEIAASEAIFSLLR
jgi:hypothetical protein